MYATAPAVSRPVIAFADGEVCEPSNLMKHLELQPASFHLAMRCRWLVVSSTWEGSVGGDGVLFSYISSIAGDATAKRSASAYSCY